MMMEQNLVRMKMQKRSKVIFSPRLIGCLACLFLLCPCLIFSQYDSVIVEKFQQNLYIGVINNVVSKLTWEMIRGNQTSLASGNFNNYLFSQESPILGPGEKYEIEFSRSKLIFPDSSYNLYEYIWPGMAYSYGNCCDTNHPRNVRINVSSDGPWMESLLEHGLIALNPKTGDILFVSGYMYLNSVASLYFQNGVDSVSLCRYVETRYYNFLPIHLQCSSDRCSFFSRAMNRVLVLSIQRNLNDSKSFKEVLMEVDGREFPFQ